MAKYLGETPVTDLTGTPYEGYGPTEWAIEYMGYGQFDGSHHKQWALDQIARILLGTKVLVTLAKWDDGTQEYRHTLDEPSPAYNKWVLEMKGKYDEENDEYEYSYNEGCAP